MVDEDLRLLSREVLETDLKELNKIDNTITLSDVLLYFRYNIEPERYNINLD